jgi:uncharacterized protein (TIRG00374 family)
VTKTARRSWTKYANLFFGLLVFGALILVAGHFAQLEQFVELAEKARPAWMILAVALQAGTYLSLAAGWRSVLARAGSPQPMRRLLPIALSKLFADQAVPSAGLGGHVVLIERLTALGVERGTAVATLILSMIGYYAAYAVLAVGTLVALWLHRHASVFLAIVVTIFLVVAVTIPALALWLRRRGGRPLPKPLEKIGPLRKLLEIVGEAPSDLINNRQLLAEVTLFNGLIFLIDAATLSVCLLAIGQGFHPAAALIALVMASIATTLSPIPMGIGSFEATSVAMLAMLSIRVEPALAATLLLRGLTLWLPLLPGLVMMRRGSKQHATE